MHSDMIKTWISLCCFFVITYLDIILYVKLRNCALFYLIFFGLFFFHYEKLVCHINSVTLRFVVLCGYYKPRKMVFTL